MEAQKCAKRGKSAQWRLQISSWYFCCWKHLSLNQQCFLHDDLAYRSSRRDPYAPICKVPHPPAAVFFPTEDACEHGGVDPLLTGCHCLGTEADVKLGGHWGVGGCKVRGDHCEKVLRCIRRSRWDHGEDELFPAHAGGSNGVSPTLEVSRTRITHLHRELQRWCIRRTPTECACQPSLRRILSRVYHHSPVPHYR